MSLGSISGTGLFNGLTPEQIKEKIFQKFYESYGRYESVSGKMWVEVYHNEGDKGEDGDLNVVWRKGEEGKPELIEDMVLSQDKALVKFIAMIQMGYQLVFNGTTKSDIEKGNALQLEKLTSAQRDGWLGTYVKGDRFIRINEFKPTEFFFESGFDGSVLETHVLTEFEAKYELDSALEDGFVREGVELDEFSNALEAFGLELDTIEAKEHAELMKSKPRDGELADELFSMFGG